MYILYIALFCLSYLGLYYITKEIDGFCITLALVEIYIDSYDKMGI